MPKSNIVFWKEKFAENKERDRRNIQKLVEQGWRVLVVWECELTNHTIGTIEKVARWLRLETTGMDEFLYEKNVIDRRKLLTVAEKKVRYRIASYDDNQ